jgi:3-dehydroquinate synthase
MLHKLQVRLPAEATDRSYDILIGTGLLDQAGLEIATRFGPRKIVVISDSHVAPLYLERLHAALKTAGHTLLQPAIMPAGEPHKTLPTLQQLAETVLQQQPDRRLLVLALGGGVVGDMAGMLAALLLRGVDYIQIPTTLLAQVDSSVGGKTGLDTPQGKNLLGAFHQPRLVLADLDLLRSLPARHWRSGFAEIVKYGLINQADFFTWCHAHGPKLLAGDAELLTSAIARSCASKAAIVAADEKESGQRALLNLGHTFGHALEAASGFGENLYHGEAVAIGCALALRFSIALGLCPASELDRYLALCAACELPTTPQLPASMVPTLLDFMSGDKKNSDGAITLILLRGIGQAFVQKGVSRQQLATFWHEVLANPSTRNAC